ncbi:MAG TPA: aldo/keto reductase [Jeotgalicoccus sp.]|nr:aldo/keto reductase [Jeotgalicoccus sp.]
MENVRSTYSLKNGLEIPVVGFGTWKTPDGDDAYNSVSEALKAGYRHIDTAAVYGNEESVGKAIKDSGLSREDVFVTSKVWNTERGYDKTIAAYEASLEKLGMDYLDLYLIHWPAIEKQNDDWEELNKESWRALMDLYKVGKVKSIGVSNFQKKHMEALKDAEILPMVNQIEFHPGWLQEETRELCKELGILVEAYSPNGNGKLLKDDTLLKIAEKYGKSVAQICIRWTLQHGTLPLPKSVTPEYIKENTEVFDFEISDEDMQTIDEMEYLVGVPTDPDNRDF